MLEEENRRLKKIVAHQATDNETLRELRSKSGKFLGEAGHGQCTLSLETLGGIPGIENFNETFRDECLNMNMLGSVEEARRIVETRRQDYNGFGPHSSFEHIDAVGVFREE